MQKENDFTGKVELRRQAEKALKEKNDEYYNFSGKSSEDMDSLIHELSVHQIELEMQNDELRRVQVELEKTRDRYSHLYDFAPVGYLTISDAGIILEANLTCASMLGIERRLLIGTPFSRFINRDDQDIFYLNRMKLIETESRQTFELRIMKKDGKQFYAQLESIAAHIADSDQIHFRIAMSDISERREARKLLDRKMAELNQRVKELNCLYKISKIRETPGISLEETLQAVVDTLPPSWQYPNIACSRITFDGKEYKSKNFNESGWKQCADIVIDNKPVGTVGIYYLREMPKMDEGPFLKEEKNLINAVAERVGKAIEHMYLAADLRTERDKLVNILNSMEDGVYIADQGHEIQYLNPSLEKEFGPLNGRKCYEYFNDRKSQCPWCNNQDVFSGEIIHWEWYCARNQKTYDLVDTPLRNSDGSLSKLEIFRDITEFRKAQKMLQTAHDDLEKKVEERTADIARANKLLKKEIVDRKKTEKVLSKNEMKLKKQAIHLEEMNTALNVLLEHREEERIKLEESIIANINRLVLPSLEKLGKGKLSPDKRLYIEVIKSNIEEIISPFSIRLSSGNLALTPTELKVANFVKEGLTSKEIASLLNISHNTVMFHRKKIRNKLGLTNKKTNSQSYIKSLS